MKKMQRVTLMPAYVLHHYDWRETSRLVEIFSLEHGRLGLVARGSRRSSSSWSAVLRPFQPLLLSWIGGGELATLVSVEAEHRTHALIGNALLSGFYMNELLLRLLPRNDSQPELFAQYGNTLTQLMQSPASALRLFEKDLLIALGYGLNLECDASTGKPLESEAIYQYLPEQGPVYEHETTAEGIQISGGALLALARGELEVPDQLRDARRLLHATLNRLLGDRPLKTKAIMNSFIKMRR